MDIHKYVPVPDNDYDPHDLHVHGKYAGSTYMGFWCSFLHGWANPPKASSYGGMYMVTCLKQSDAAGTAWGDLIPKTSSFTDVGITKINESLVAYVYALLGA